MTAREALLPKSGFLLCLVWGCFACWRRRQPFIRTIFVVFELPRVLGVIFIFVVSYQHTSGHAVWYASCAIGATL